MHLPGVPLQQNAVELCVSCLPEELVITGFSFCNIDAWFSWTYQELPHVMRDGAESLVRLALIFCSLHASPIMQSV